MPVDPEMPGGGATPAADDLRIVIAGRERVDELEPLWLALHRHHRAVSNVPVQADDALSWELWRTTYGRCLDAGDGFLCIADRPAGLAGYAMVTLRSGPDDTYPFAGRFAEVASLVVAPEARGGGVGGRLLDAVDAELAHRGIRDQVISVMAGNDDAQRLYERRGFVPGEIILFRLGDRGVD
jgi:ribosomal protein S18 acetylase RimI-like enzyme